MIGLDNSLALDLAEQQDRSGNDCLHENGNVGCLPARMNLAERSGQIAIDSNNKRDARNTGDSAADSTGIAHRYKDRGKHT